MDLGILFGFLGTWLLIAWALLESGDVTMFINAPSFLLVIGASVTVVIYATPMRYVKQIMAILRKSFFFQPESLGKYAPAFGMIGTLIGLVIMLRNMDNPAAIGPGMAVALLTTLYGALIANGVALPLADRLARRSAEEVLAKTIIIKGVMAIQSGDNPRIVEQKLRTFLPPVVRKAAAEEKAA